jgi:hypothetical protein
MSAAVTQRPLLHQCAWCWCLMDGLGNYTIEVGHNLTTVPGLAEHVTHGICAACEDRVMGQP